VQGWRSRPPTAPLLDAIAAFGLPVCADRAVAAGADGLVAFHQAHGAKRDALPFDIDGVVYKVNDLACSSGWASSRASRAGRWRTSTRRRSR
jgi:DNA ligase (NAD+)